MKYILLNHVSTQLSNSSSYQSDKSVLHVFVFDIFTGRDTV